MPLRVKTHTQKETRMQLTDLLMRLVDGQNFKTQDSKSLADRTLSKEVPWYYCDFSAFFLRQPRSSPTS